MRAKKREFEEKSKKKRKKHREDKYIINEEFGKDVHENLSLF